MLETKIREILTLHDSLRSRELTKEEFDEVVTKLWSVFDEPLATFDPNTALMSEQEHAIWCNQQIETLSEKAKWSLPYGNRDHDEPRVHFRYYMNKLLEDEFNITNISPDSLEKVVNEFFHVKIHEFQRMKDSFTPKEFVPRVPTHIEPKYLDIKSTSTVNIPSTPNQKSISNTWKDYENEKVGQGTWSNEKTRSGYNTQFSDLLEILGEDLPINHVSREHANNVLSSLKKFPAHRVKRFKGAPLSEIPEDAEAISANSVNQRLDLISGFFKWAMKRGHITTNPFEGLRVKATNQSYATYTDKDIQELFNLPPNRIKKAWQFWIPRIALYSGARQNEIANLRTTDFYFDENLSIHYMRIKDDEDRTVKTSAAVRQIPIHPELINNGLLDYIEQVRASGSTSIWPALTPKSGKLGQRVSEYWGTLKTEYKLPSNPKNEKGERKVFHSMRRLVINQMRDAETPLNYIQAVIGHEQSMLGETGTYLDDLPLPQCYEAINAIKHNQVSWEHPKKYLTAK